MIREIVPTDHPALSATAAAVPVAEILSPTIRNLIRDLKHTLAPEDLGVAIAAPQIGEAVRIFVIAGRAFLPEGERVKKEDTPPDRAFINPEITRIAKKQRPMHEGCLSVRGKWGMVPRAEKVSIKAYGEDGKPFSMNASGLIAHIIQHEIDHLEGVLYIDKANVVYDEHEEAHAE